MQKEKVYRYILAVISLFFIGMGVAFTKYGGIGVSTISSVANVVSLRFTFISFGSWIIISYFIMISIQVVLLGKKFPIFQLLQVPVSFLTGYFTDFNLLWLKEIPVNGYYLQLLLVVIGVVVLGFGICLGVIADVVMSPAEALVKVIADKTHKDFGTVKIAFDIFCVLLAVMLSVIFFNGKIAGVREGTLISAFFTGVVIKFFKSFLNKPLNEFFKKGGDK